MSPFMFEPLEGRELMSAAPSLGASLTRAALKALSHAKAGHSIVVQPLATTADGTYTGTASGQIGQTKYKVPVTVIIDQDGTRVKFKIKLPSGLTLKPSLKVKFNDSSDGFITAPFSGDFGEGVVEIKGKKLTITATIDLILETGALNITATGP